MKQTNHYPSSTQHDLTSTLPAPRNWWQKLLSRLLFNYVAKRIDLRFTGLENLPPSAPYILAANHVTYIDGLLIIAGLPENVHDKICVLAAADLATDHGLIGKLLLKLTRPILVDRSSKRGSIRTLLSARNACQQGNILLIHPEGTRTADGELGELQSGAAYIAIKSKCPLVPVYISGGYEFFSRHQRKPSYKDPATGKKRIVTIKFGSAINPQPKGDAHELTAQLRDSLIALK